ncbi:MAG: T9SS type A sorting domain-containing protein [Bacteroidota bacterium]
MKPLLLFALTAFTVIFLVCFPFDENPKQENVSGAGLSLDHWFASRSYPDKTISTEKYRIAFDQKKALQQTKNGPGFDEWEAMGPKNIGGRTLRIAFNPQNPNTIYAGTASGGLWRSYTAGAGINAWERVATGFPVLGVPAIIISPLDSNIMYIGTGEVYNSSISAPGIANRITRGTYGTGILKTTDGGVTWSKVLDWEYADMTGVQNMAMNPLDENTIYAATTEGLFRSYDAGENWSLIHSVPMAVDIDINPVDTNLVFVTNGSYNEPTSGTYRSVNGGQSFSLMNLPTGYTGKTLIAISPSAPSIMYASVANAFNSLGLYQSVDSGASWSLVNIEDVAKWQGWYSHDIAVSPILPSVIIFVGIDVWKSTNGGSSLNKKTSWQNWYFGQVPVGGPEGPGDYAHADIHFVAYHPTEPNTVFLGTDGGVFVSFDNGENWEGRNGGFQCTQFYANFANSDTDSLLAIGGMQDNSTAIYTGDDAWTRVIGGDGMSSAINQDDNMVMYGSYQNLGLLRSDNGGLSFSGASPSGAFDELRNFSSPYEIAPSNQDILYAGAQRLYKTENRGESWEPTSIGFVDNGNPILTIAVAFDDPDVLYVGTSDRNGFPPEVYKSEDGGETFIWQWQLPDRYPLDIAFDPLDNQIAYVVFGGFGVDHVWKTINGGQTWNGIGSGLPDIPTNTVVVDPLIPNHVYVGNDHGVYLSRDAGATWELYSDGLPDATLVMHLSISASNQKLRVATHGNGIYQTPLAEEALTSFEEVERTEVVSLSHNFPNPVDTETNISFSLNQSASLKLSLFDISGRNIRTIASGDYARGEHLVKADLSDLAQGAYVYRIEGLTDLGVFSVSKVLVKN